MDRRVFLKLSASASAVGVFAGCSDDDDNTSTAPPVEPPVEPPVAQQFSYNACLVNCGSNCPLKVFTEDGVVIRVETEFNETDEYGVDHQIRPCPRGRSIRQRTYAPDRLKTPLKRVAGSKRGAGQWQEITWDQAFSEIAAKVTELRGQYGPRSILTHYGSGAYYGFHNRSNIFRALRLSGGHLNEYGNYSWGTIDVATPAILGQRTQSGSQLSTLRQSDLLVGFGFNPCEIRMSGSGEGYDFVKALEDNPGLEVIHVDPRYTDSMLGKESRWLGIRPGTDGALAEAIAYEMVSSGWVAANSKAFLDEHCIGYDRASLEQAKVDFPDYAQYIDSDENYYDYIMRQGKFAGEPLHDAAWAAPITGIPETDIKDLAQKIMNASAPFIAVGAGPNRHACGEQTIRSLFMLAILTGKIGQAGCSNGALPRNYGRGTGGASAGSNPESASISFFTWAEAIERGEEMSVLADGVRLPAEDLDANGDGTLGTNVKAVFSMNGNAMMNQHADLNKTRAILEDDSLCELIVNVDCWMTASAQFADYVLPDTSWLETNDLAGDSYASGELGYVTFTTAAIEPLYDCRDMYQIGLGLARAFGVEGEYTGGVTQEQALEQAYQDTKTRNPDWDLPETYAEAQQIGIYRAFRPEGYVAMKKEIIDGDKSDMLTPSKKIEIYSLDWAKKAATWSTLSDADYDQITALPKYAEAWKGYEDTDRTEDEFPLQLCGYHTKGRTHSSYHNVPWLRDAVEDAIWVNPMDATGFTNGQMVTVESAQGAIRLPIRITPRVLPGVTALGQGAWYKAAQLNGVDEGGCINTLTKYRPTPVAKGNPQHTINVKLTA